MFAPRIQNGVLTPYLEINWTGDNLLALNTVSGCQVCPALLNDAQLTINHYLLRQYSHEKRNKIKSVFFEYVLFGDVGHFWA